MLTIAEAAAYLGVNPATIRRRIEDGTLVGYRVGTHLIRLRAEAVEALLTPMAE
jgi:excisionase family DNA binding protein